MPNGNSNGNARPPAGLKVKKSHTCETPSKTSHKIHKSSNNTSSSSALCSNTTQCRPPLNTDPTFCQSKVLSSPKPSCRDPPIRLFRVPQPHSLPSPVIRSLRSPNADSDASSKSNTTQHGFRHNQSPAPVKFPVPTQSSTSVPKKEFAEDTDCSLCYYHWVSALQNSYVNLYKKSLQKQASPSVHTRSHSYNKPSSNVTLHSPATISKTKPSHPVPDSPPYCYTTTSHPLTRNQSTERTSLAPTSSETCRSVARLPRSDPKPKFKLTHQTSSSTKVTTSSDSVLSEHATDGNTKAVQVSNKASSCPKCDLHPEKSTLAAHLIGQSDLHLQRNLRSMRNNSYEQTNKRGSAPVLKLHSLYHQIIKSKCIHCESSEHYDKFKLRKPTVADECTQPNTRSGGKKSSMCLSRSQPSVQKGNGMKRKKSWRKNTSVSGQSYGSSSSSCVVKKRTNQKIRYRKKTIRKKKRKQDQGQKCVWKRKKRKLSKGGLPRRAKSTYSRPNHPQIRTYRTNMPSASVHKIHSDTSLENSIRNLAISSSSSAISSKSHVPSRKHSSAGGGKTFLSELARQISSKAIKNIVVMAGAGISTASGIPDFRSPGTGLYDNLQKYNIPYPQAIFDIDYFETNPKPFYTLAKELYPTGRYRPNYIHYFLRLLHEKGILLRLYTQNIDGLEKMAGLPPEKLVEAHGTFTLASCVRCKQSHSPEDVKDCTFHNRLPRCKKAGCYGLVKPDIVFFGENLPRRFYYYLRDFPQADLLIVMGTSLEVEPFANIVDSTRMYIPRILFNREAVGPFERKRRMNDTVVAGDLIQEVKAFVKLLGWSGDLEKLITEEKKRLESLADLEEGISPEEIAHNQSLARLSSASDTKSTVSLDPVDNTDSSSQSESQSSSSSDVRKVKHKARNSEHKARNNVRSNVTKLRTNSQSRFNTSTKPGASTAKRPDPQIRRFGHSGLNRATQSRQTISAQPHNSRSSHMNTNRNMPGLPGRKFNTLPRISYAHRTKTSAKTKRTKDNNTSEESSSEDSSEEDDSSACDE